MSDSQAKQSDSQTLADFAPRSIKSKGALLQSRHDPVPRLVAACTPGGENEPATRVPKNKRADLLKRMMVVSVDVTVTRRRR